MIKCFCSGDNRVITEGNVPDAERWLTKYGYEQCLEIEDGEVVIMERNAYSEFMTHVTPSEEVAEEGTGSVVVEVEAETTVVAPKKAAKKTVARRKSSKA
jgi:hypothetical protein